MQSQAISTSAPAKKLRILVADDHEVVREGLRITIERESNWEVCGTATNGREALEYAKTLQPDVIVLDMTMPELTGLEAVRELRRLLPNTEVLIFSAHRSEEVIVQAFEAGAKSYIQKTEAAQYLVTAIKSLAQHKPFFTPEVSRIIFAKFGSSDGSKKRNVEGHKLTPRETAVVRFLAEGSGNKEIAAKMGVNIRTVETHRATLMRKLRLDSVAAVVRYAIRNNIIEA